MLGLNGPLVFYCARVAVSGVTPLINRQGCGKWRRAVVTTIPARTSLFPVMSPALFPVGCGIHTPSLKVLWRLAVVADRNNQHQSRHEFRRRQLPGSVVPVARIPIVLLVDPIHAVVKEIIRGAARIQPALLGVDKSVSEDAARRALKRLEESAGVAWLERHLAKTPQPLWGSPWILDLETTVKCL